MLLTAGSIDQLIADGEVQLIGRPPAVWMGVPLRTPKGVIGVLVMQHYDDSSVYGQRSRTADLDQAIRYRLPLSANGPKRPFKIHAITSTG